MVSASASYLFSGFSISDGEDITVDNNPFIPLYGVVIVLWSHLFRKCWVRRCNQLAIQWGTYGMNFSDTACQPSRVLRNSFHGK